MPVNPPDSIKRYVIVDHGNGVYFLSEGAYWSMAVVSTAAPRRSYERGNGGGQGNLDQQGDRGDQGDGDQQGDRSGRGGRGGQGKTLLIIDAPTGFWSESSFLAAMAELKSLSGADEISDMLYSHTHTDHIGNAHLVARLNPRVQIHGSNAVCDRLIHQKDSRRPAPTNCYAHNFTLSRFGIAVHDIGDGHSLGNRAIYHEQAKVLMYIDIVFPGWTMFKELAQAEYAPDFIEAHDKILQYDFDVYVGGHVTRLGNRQDVLTQKEYVTDILENAAYALDNINWSLAGPAGTFDPSSPNYLNYWYLWEQVQGEMIATCTSRTLAKWSGKLGAVDVYTPTHCFKAIESRQID